MTLIEVKGLGIYLLIYLMIKLEKENLLTREHEWVQGCTWLSITREARPDRWPLGRLLHPHPWRYRNKLQLGLAGQLGSQRQSGERPLLLAAKKACADSVFPIFSHLKLVVHPINHYSLLFFFLGGRPWVKLTGFSIFSSSIGLTLFFSALTKQHSSG